MKMNNKVMGEGENLKRIIVFICSITLLTPAYSQVAFHGGKGLFRVLEAEPVTPADIFVNANFSTYFEKTGPEQMAKYYNANINATVGIAHYLEAFINFVPYQDDQYHLIGRIGDTYLGVKYLSPLATDAFKLGITGFYKFPTAERANVPYEIFTTDKPAWGAKALVTLDLLNVLPSFPVKLNVNFGYMDHNIYDAYFRAKYDQLLIGSGIKFSVRSLQIFTEYTAEVFFNVPQQVDFSQNSMRITPGIRFLGPWKNTIDVMFDFSLTKYDSLKNKDRFHKEYFNWKATIGMTRYFTVFKYFDKTARLERQKRMEELRRLEEIRKKREKADQDLNKMKNILEKNKSEKK